MAQATTRLVVIMIQKAYKEKDNKNLKTQKKVKKNSLHTKQGFFSTEVDSNNKRNNHRKIKSPAKEN
jgi:hypothetical protein